MEEIRNQLHLIYLNRLKSLPFITKKVGNGLDFTLWSCKNDLAVEIISQRKWDGRGVPPQLGFSETTER